MPPARQEAKEDDDDELSSKNDDELDADEDTGLTENQNRLLYIISLYSHRAENSQDKDTWIRKPALLVLIYEGIAANVLDYDYAPQSDLLDNRRVWLNISQEGKSDVEFLREEELLNGLQISTKSYRPITCFQVSAKGQELVKRVGRKEKEAVHEFVYAKGTRELLSAIWDGVDYFLITESGYKRKSTITDTEDVSYVSSAYVPQCLRYGGRPTLSNAHRAHESAISASNIRDDLDEVITLNSVSVIVAEYIPFGANQIVQLNHNVGSTERVQGGFISPAIDDNSAETAVRMTPELTSVDILDYTLTNHINFEAEIHLAEESGVVQVETFGVSLNSEGTCFYGMQIEAVMDRIKDNISLDHLSRLVVDVQQDSSHIVDSIITSYQRDLMQLIFLGDAEARNKINLIIANEISPHLTAEEYMDKGEYENELKQVLGDTKAAYDISEHDTLIFGSHGLLIAGPNARHHEPLLCAYLQFITIDLFLQNFFARMWMLNDDMQTTHRIIDNSDKDPRSLERIQYRIFKLASDVIQLEEILGYLLEALEIIELPPEPPEQAGRSLYERLEIAGMRNQLLRRSLDLKKNIAASHKHLDILKDMSTIVSNHRNYNMEETLELNTKKLCQLQEANDKSATRLQILQFIFAGILTFMLLDRITGDWTVVDRDYMLDFKESVLGNPGAWFFVSIIIWFVMSFGFSRAFQLLNFVSKGTTHIRLKINRKITVSKLQQFLDSKIHSQIEHVLQLNNYIVRVTYEDTLHKQDWGGCIPKITLEFDKKTEFLLTIEIEYNRREANKKLVFDADNLREKIMEELSSVDVFDDKSADWSKDDLAVDKRESLQRLVEEAERKGAAEEAMKGKSQKK